MLYTITLGAYGPLILALAEGFGPIPSGGNLLWFFLLLIFLQHAQQKMPKKSYTQENTPIFKLPPLLIVVEFRFA